MKIRELIQLINQCSDNDEEEIMLESFDGYEDDRDIIKVYKDKNGNVLISSGGY